MSRKWHSAIAVGFAALICGAISTQAVADLVYTHTVDVSQWIKPLQPAVWVHEYDHSVPSPAAVTLTVTASDVSVNEAQVWLVDSYGLWHYLGHLQPSLDATSDTVFDLNANWLDAVPVGARIQWLSGPNNHQVWIGKSTLSVIGAAPAPAALILGVIGLTCLGLVTRLRGG